VTVDAGIEGNTAFRTQNPAFRSQNPESRIQNPAFRSRIHDATYGQLFWEGGDNMADDDVVGDDDTQSTAPEVLLAQIM